MQIRQRGKDGKASKQPGISRNTQPDRRSKEGTERTSSIWEGCRANPRAVSMAVLDTGRPLYLCMGKSNRRESGGNEIRERRRYDSGVKGKKPDCIKKPEHWLKKEVVPWKRRTEKVLSNFYCPRGLIVYSIKW